MNRVNIVYICDDNFAPQTGVSLYSLLKNNKQLEKDIYIINTGIGNNNLFKMKRLCKKYNTRLQIIDALDIISKLNELSITMPNQSSNRTTLVRLFIHHLLPNDTKKIIYLDGDTLILGSLQYLSDLDTKKAIGAVIDADYYFMEKNIVEKFDKYFNAGILWINLEKYEQRIRQISIIDLISKNYRFADQDILNLLFKNNVEFLEPLFNFSTKYRLVKPWVQYIWTGKNKRIFYNIEVLKNAQLNPIIVHFTTSLFGRPWENNCEDSYVKVWRQYLYKSPWSDYKYVNRKLSYSNRIGRCIYKIMPQVIFALIDYEFSYWKYLKSRRGKK